MSQQPSFIPMRRKARVTGNGNGLERGFDLAYRKKDRERSRSVTPRRRTKWLGAAYRTAISTSTRRWYLKRSPWKRGIESSIRSPAFSVGWRCAISGLSASPSRYFIPEHGPRRRSAIWKTCSYRTRRGSGAGGALINDLIAKGHASGWRKVYWQTRANNAAARRLYDTFATADGFVRYTVELR